MKMKLKVKLKLSDDHTRVGATLEGTAKKWKWGEKKKKEEN